MPNATPVWSVCIGFDDADDGTQWLQAAGDRVLGPLALVGGPRA